MLPEASTVFAEVIQDSISPDGIRLTSVQYTSHRFILAETNTHRVFSRNARSSRAVPTKRLIEEVRTNPAMPLALRHNKPGMQGGDALGEAEQREVMGLWLKAASNAADTAEAMLKLNVAKEVLNRVLEPFMWVHGIISSTEWDNWFELRDHDAAQPEIRALAQAMREAIDASTPTPLQHGEWHLPYITEADRRMAEDAMAIEKYPCMILRHLSAARCARISYSPFDGDPSWERELGRVERLLIEGHWSPFEHQATPDEMADGVWRQPEFHGNFRGWVQNRRVLAHTGAAQ